MTTDEDFLAAILANPADDHIRLFFADHLQETGREDRAVEIRTDVGDWNAMMKATAAGAPFPEGQHLLALREDGTFVKVNVADQSGTQDAGGIVIGWGVQNRGFVAEVRLPLAALLGGPCVCRNGQVYVGGFDPRPVVTADQMAVCPDCDGTGQRPGLAADLFLAHPIERVVATDKSPERRHLDRWAWYRQYGDGSDQDSIPDVLWPAGERNNRLHFDGDDEGEAMSWLSDRLVAYGRERAAEKKAQPQGAA